MSKTDVIFKTMCRDIIDNGRSTEGHKVRPKWEDGTPAHTVRRFGIVNRYNLQEEFPALTLRKTAIKSATDEILWIWQRKSNNIHDLKPHIWDEWADKNGSIGTAYGYQMGIKYYWTDVTDDGLEKMYGKNWKNQVRGLGVIIDDHPEKNTYFKEAGGDRPVICAHDSNTMDKHYFYMDQVDKVLYDLINQPFSRRIMTNIFNFSDLATMNLQPCAYSMTFSTTEDENGLILNGILNQRSQDVLAANNWNVAQYAVLMHMIARHVGMRVGELVHVIADAHIYDRHVPMVEELISRESHPAPKFILNPEKTNFYDFTSDDVILEDYVTGEQITNIPIAV